MEEIDYRNFHIIARLIILDGVVKIILPDGLSDKILSKCDEFFKNRISNSESKSESEPLYDVCLVFKNVYFFECLEENYENKEIQRNSVPWFNEVLFECNRIPIIYCITGFSIDNNSDNSNSVPRSVNYMDSSIWTYCLDDSKTPERVDWVLKSIYDNYRNGYYSTSQAREFLNLNARLSLNSYLEGNDGDVAHGQFVVPFLFHSEYKARMTLDEIVKNGNSKADEFCCGYKWRFLLVDDHAEDGLSVVGGNADKKGPSKINIILDRLMSLDGMKVKARKYDSTEEYSDDHNIIIEYVSNLEDCKKALKQKKYDIILMDYLLGVKQQQLGREYSYELFDSINDLKTNGAIGPGKRLYFMFISAYVYAIQERLDERLISRSTKDWFIGRGACPLNTPEIFLYHLHSIMQKRVSTMLEVDSKVSEGGKNILCQMFDTPDDNLDTVCREKFVDLLNLISHVKTLVDNDLTQKDSVLARSIFEKEKIPTDRAFWEHFRHLCYLMGYELKSRWPEWWEEYHFIKMELLNYGDTYKNLLNHFRDYIVNVSQNSH